MKQQKIIHLLADGRKKYSTFQGKIEKWEKEDIEALEHNFKKYGHSAFTADFSRYDVVAKNLRRRFPDAKIVEVVGYEMEDYKLPLREGIIF